MVPLPLSGCLLHSTSKDITLVKNHPIKIFVDHLNRRKFLRLILRDEFFKNYGIDVNAVSSYVHFVLV